MPEKLPKGWKALAVFVAVAAAATVVGHGGGCCCCGGTTAAGSGCYCRGGGVGYVLLAKVVVPSKAEHSVFTPPKEKPPTTEAEPPVFTPRWFLKKPQTSPEKEGEARKKPSGTKLSTIVQTRGH
ncbi:hypothetical protein Tco_0908029 [Tanacetum coccineum]|uniref:Secreted protein n=1 Tax=Tanacetum coccineum TaxID=301880 RepID=A0ABQ5CM38_9ASTR